MIKRYFPIKYKGICLAAVSILSLMACNTPADKAIIYPSPTTEIKMDMEEDGKKEAREKWLEDLHRCEEGLDWRAIEYETSFKKYMARQAQLAHIGLRSGDEVLANGQLIGRWRERGSANQAGSVVATSYHKEEDKIYTISAGGSLFRASPDGLDWEVINDRLRFSGQLLDFVGEGEDQRMVALINRLPHYSTDNGITWEPSSGIVHRDRWANSYFPIVHNSKIFLLSKPDYWSALTIYQSDDLGESFREVKELHSHDAANYYMFSPHHHDDLFFVERIDTFQINMFKLNDTSDLFEPFSTSVLTGYRKARCNMAGTVRDSTLELIIYNGKNEVLKSTDGGTNWAVIGNLPADPWGVGIYISPSDPNIMLMGAVECHRSSDGGRTWRTINKWWDYYGDVVNKLHADMMYFNEFVDHEGRPALLISNHGGLSISRNGGLTNTNIGLYGLNVSQYYSVRTDPLDRELIYAGTQDQGLQRGRKDQADWVEFEQVISGDYGHISFTGDGRHMWCVYPGGWISYYENPHFDGSPSLSYEIDSEHEAVWIPPITAAPDASKNMVYAAGGNIHGGEGSYLIKLKVENGSIVTDQIDYDFRAHTNNGTVAAIAFSPLDSAKLYVATNNGFIFTSTDMGQSFSRGIIKVPGAHYLYGSSILPGKNDDQTIIVGGSGYSTSPVVKSDDGGRIFRSMSDGLPPTTVLQLAANDDESLIFAATEAGPYVYVVADGIWYDMSGLSAPAQRYWSVEYLSDEKIARFGTYGRGIWDFEIDEITTQTPAAAKDEELLYPNPATETIYLSTSKNAHYRIINTNGQTVAQGISGAHGDLDISRLTTGSYYLIIDNRSHQFIKI